MASKGAIQVVGLSDLQKALRLMEVPSKEVSQAGFDAASIVVVESRPTAPVLTGRLRDSVRAARVQRGAVVRVNGNKVPYANPIHWGWFRRHILPNPFIYNALDNRIEEVYNAYFKQMTKLVEKVEANAKH